MALVAKSYQNLIQIGDIFKINNKSYIKVKTKNGIIKTVRVYTKSEYIKMYPDSANDFVENRVKTQKEVLGFQKGYITIFKGTLTNESNDYFKLSSARYTRMWGWYFMSTDELPDDIPEEMTPIKLEWSLIGDEDGFLKSESEVSSIVDSLLYGDDPSEYQGEVGDKIERILTVEKAIALDGYYGPSTCYSMRDYDGNIYIWITSAVKTKLEEGKEYIIKGKVKEHKNYKGKKQTILTRCACIE